MVDDNHNLTDFLSKELKSLFKAIYIAHDGREAFEIAQKQVPDIIAVSYTHLLRGFQEGDQPYI